MTVQDIKPPPAEIRSGNMDACAAIEALRAGKIIRRFNGNQVGKYYRMHHERVQVAQSAAKVAEGQWEVAGTDIDSWVMSTFRVVRLTMRIIELSYED